MNPPVPVRTEVSGDRKFITIIPLAPWAGESGGQLSVAIDGNYLVNPTRKGLRFSGGTVGGAFSQHSTFAVRAIGADDTLPLPVPAAPGDPAGVWELYRSQPPPDDPAELQPDRLRFPALPDRARRAMSRARHRVGRGRPAEGSNTTVVDPATRALPVPGDARRRALASAPASRSSSIYPPALRVLPHRDPGQREWQRARQPGAERVRRVAASRSAGTSCAAQFCNPQTDLLTVFGGAEPARMGGVQQAPGRRHRRLRADGDGVTATSQARRCADTQSVSLLLIDNATGVPLPLDYGFATTRTRARAASSRR